MDERVNKNTYKLNDGKRSDYNKHLNQKMVDYFDDLSSSKSNKIAIKGLLCGIGDKVKSFLSIFHKKASKVDISALETDDVVLSKKEYRILIASVCALIGVSLMLMGALWYYCM